MALCTTVIWIHTNPIDIKGSPVFAYINLQSIISKECFNLHKLASETQNKTLCSSESNQPVA